MFIDGADVRANLGIPSQAITVAAVMYQGHGENERDYRPARDRSGSPVLYRRSVWFRSLSALSKKRHARSPDI